MHTFHFIACNIYFLSEIIKIYGYGLDIKKLFVHLINKIHHNWLAYITLINKIIRKKLHPSYWYNKFAKLCHTTIIVYLLATSYGEIKYIYNFWHKMHTRILHYLPVRYSL